MADFKQALEKVLAHEGGYVNDPDDPGGETYKGIARKMWPQWKGWDIIDFERKNINFPKNLPLIQTLENRVEDFYKIHFWDKVQGDLINDKEVATCIFDFAVNAGISTALKLACEASEATAPYPANINNMDREVFLAAFTLAKIARYIAICKKRPTSKKYFFGWICRSIGV